MTTTQTTAGAGGDSTTSSSALSRWSDLPDDILDKICLKITSPRDHVRLAAVCRPWRATAARLPAPSAAPLLLLSPRLKTGGVKHLCGGPNDSWFLHVPDKAADKCFMGSHEGGWVAALDHHTRMLVLVNLFSGAEVGVCSQLPADLWADVWWHPIFRVIFSDDPASSRGCILATITDGFNNIALCNVGCRSGWTVHGWENKMFTDIAFCSGDLYGLAYPDEELVRFKIGIEEDGSPMVISTQQLAIQRQHVPTAEYNDCYIVELHGKPSMAIIARWLPNHEPFFKIFELVDADTSEAYRHKWEEVTSLGDYALFLGPGNSKAVHVPLGADRLGFERNHIYYTKATRSTESNLRGDEVYSLRLVDDRLMYCREDRNIEDGLGQTGYYTTGWENGFMWLHPPEL